MKERNYKYKYIHTTKYMHARMHMHTYLYSYTYLHKCMCIRCIHKDNISGFYYLSNHKTFRIHFRGMKRKFPCLRIRLSPVPFLRRKYKAVDRLLKMQIYTEKGHNHSLQKSDAVVHSVGSFMTHK